VVLARVHVLTEGRIPLIGIGGIDSGAAPIRQDRGWRRLAAALHRPRLPRPRPARRIKRDLVAYATAIASSVSPTAPAARPKPGLPSR
jgi:hypothetical protein